MVTSKDKILRKELIAAGAKPVELDSLIKISSQLEGLKLRSVPKPARRWRLATSLSVSMFLGVLIGGTVIASAQSSLPGSVLYPAKRLSENVAVTIDPDYRATLMMRRSEEVTALVDTHAKPQLVLATLNSYKTQAADYKTKNYAAYSYCKNNLEVASTLAPAQERTAINNTLTSLSDID